ncbi:MULTISPECIES: NUDIX domain-containing protein [Nocardia]|uniref:NUDIX domain-containing protein n=1 Tax=Nocardia TaxID=1817 RepID=UPI000BEFE69B|nr:MULTISPECIES: NUDIX domain-containing protein [Nocardia]MBF6185114.1 NUDIX domain-containing protein [Nocardia farcinica]MBF6310950.1 NUDIX domain-containing protein [Nocardia farcinica]MBF6409886.1 NUDIX domain-containing protein [Nocardia farcinica]PEH77232.1 DNA mismatch repair protein MutT [Nocardia sp. FDAARGOS_372]UEX21747.1 NUDIX domain-containing protein [Nocardia farcinica]
MPSLIDDLTTTAHRDGVQQLVVGAVIEHQDRVLLLRRPGNDFMGGIWELPSGKVEPGENLDHALAREVEEETGLQVTGIGRYIDSFDYRSGSGKHSRQFNFTVECAASEPIQLTEHDAYTWTPLTEEPPVTAAVKQTLTTYRNAY